MNSVTSGTTLSPGDPMALSVSGGAHVYRGNYFEAHRFYDQAIAADPLEPVPYARKAAALVAERRYDEAIALCRAAEKRFTYPWLKVCNKLSARNRLLRQDARITLTK